jgi:catechol 2,3-dioxygenase-like lactoylglutathione lyase family enzyme
MDRAGRDVISVKKIDHLVLRTTDVSRMVQFYEEVLGCRVERALAPATGLTQLRAGDALIDIVAVDSELGRAGGGPPGSSGNNLDHFCLELQDIGQSELREWLVSKGVEVSPFETRYGAGGFAASIYIEDPDGNTVELRPDKL